MFSQDVFSWAEDENGKMVYVDDVPQGKACRCKCPCCHEILQARQGVERAHGFAHMSKERGANLDICLKVIMFKLAEQIISTERKIFVPSYYGIFKSKTIEFQSVEIKGTFEREDRQPDIIAITADGEQYLIEFSFGENVRHIQDINYEKLNCLEIDLSRQKINDRDSLKNFLLTSDEDRKWLNNETYFKSIENVYKKNKKPVRIVSEEECQSCLLKDSCCAVQSITNEGNLLIIQNNQRFNLCKTEEYNIKMTDYKRQQERYNHLCSKGIEMYQNVCQNQIPHENQLNNMPIAV